MSQQMDKIISSIRPILTLKNFGALIAAFCGVSVFRYLTSSPFKIRFLRLHGLTKWNNFIHGNTKEERLLNQVFSHAEEGNPLSVMKVIDDYGWNGEWMMHVGDKKGEILDNELLKRKPMTVIELGAYCGYSAVRIGRLLGDNCRLISIEKNPLFAAISTKIIEYAGLSNKVKIIVGTAQNIIPLLKEKYGMQFVDLFFIDHWKDLYLSDLKVIEKSGVLREGSVLVADNVIIPGAPDYLKYVRNNPNYKTQFYESTLEYINNLRDGIEVSVVLHKP